MFPTPKYKTRTSERNKRKGGALSVGMNTKRLKIWPTLVAVLLMIGMTGQAIAAPPTIDSVTPVAGNEGNIVSVTISITDGDSSDWDYFVDWLDNGSYVGQLLNFANTTATLN